MPGHRALVLIRRESNVGALTQKYARHLAKRVNLVMSVNKSDVRLSIAVIERYFAMITSYSKRRSKGFVSVNM
jgi:hypothetical protein